MAAIKVENLYKVFRITQKSPGLGGAFKSLVHPEYKYINAINGISFTIEHGESVGYIGVNGAGKSTTIKMLTGILAPTDGHIEVLGRNPFKHRIQNAREIGAVFGQRSQLWWDLPLIDSLNLLADIYEIDKSRFKRQLVLFTDILELDELLSKPIRNMSLGQKMRSELAAALLHEPKVIFLDEPTIGLDVIVKERIRAFVLEQNNINGTTIMLTTHDLGDIEELCNRVIIVDAGTIVYDGQLDKIKERFGRYRMIHFDTSSMPDKLDIPVDANIILKESNRLTLRFDRSKITASRIASIILSQVDVRDFSLEEPDLETIIKEIYNGSNKEAIV